MALQADSTAADRLAELERRILHLEAELTAFERRFNGALELYRRVQIGDESSLMDLWRRVLVIEALIKRFEGKS